MAQKKTTKKSRTSNRSAKKQGIHLKWWMGVVLVAVVALSGVAILRFSRAYGPNDCSNTSYCYIGRIEANYFGVLSVKKYNSGKLDGPTTVFRPTGVNNYQYRDFRSADGNCAGIRPGGFKPDNSWTFKVGTTVEVITGCG